jgi:hypothetical protein
MKQETDTTGIGVPYKVSKPKAAELAKAFGLTAVRIYQYTPGIAVNHAIRTGLQFMKNANQFYPVTQINTRAQSRVERLSSLNTPIFSELRIEDNVRYKTFRNGVEKEVVLANFLPIDTALFQVKQKKNIIETPVQGMEGGGSVVEYITLNDYDVEISGGLYGKNGEYPWDEVENLIAYLDAPVPIIVYSPFLELFSIFQIVVHSYELPQRAGRQSEQLFKITAKSSADVMLIL